MNKKKAGRPIHGKEKKKSYNVYLEPKKRTQIVKHYGSLTKAIETLDINTKLQNDYPKPN